MSIITRLVSAYKLWHEYWPHLTRPTKYTLAQKVDVTFTEVLDLLFTASYLEKNQKLIYLQRAIGRFDNLKFLFQVLWEIKSIDNKKYVLISAQLTEIGKMLGGWYRQVLSQTQTPSH